MESPDPRFDEGAPPASARPFAPRSPGLPGGAGCGKPVVVGCVVLVVLLGIAALVLFVRATDMFGWALERFESEVVEALPEDLSPAERSRLQAAFAETREAVESGRADPAALERLQQVLLETAQSSRDGLSRQQVAELTRALEEVAAGPGEPGERPPRD